MDRTTLEVALGQLDPTDDEHWTADGAPKLAVLSDLVGEPVTRSLVTKEFPLFTRDTTSEPEPEPEDLFDLVDQAEAHLNECRSIVDAAQENLTKAQTSYGAALKARDDAYPPMTNDGNIRAYLDQSQKDRETRGSHSDAIRDASYIKKAPIDRAFVTNKNRAAHRPVHPRNQG